MLRAIPNNMSSRRSDSLAFERVLRRRVCAQKRKTLAARGRRNLHKLEALQLFCDDLLQDVLGQRQIRYQRFSLPFSSRSWRSSANSAMPIPAYCFFQL